MLRDILTLIYALKMLEPGRCLPFTPSYATLFKTES